MSVLLPVMAVGSFTFHSQIVPRYLLTGRKRQFVMYTIYLTVIVIWLEIWVIIGALVLLANYSYSGLGEYAGDVRLLVVLQVLLVFGDGFLLSWASLKRRDQEIQELREANKKQELKTIEVIVNRQTVPIPIEQILYIESFSDYVKIHVEDRQLVVREKISKLEERLPENFMRVHRSFLINRNAITAFNRSGINIGHVEIPVGRKYAQDTRRLLSSGPAQESSSA
ncbi:MAG: LytTR family DNA-binding domain-containing protein [Cytophagales bacterium]|nr:LytTR family DNA-binding domain-containing protein [Cytophagales bacterium]